MRDDEHIACENCSVSLCSADVNDEVGKESADCRIEQRTAEPSYCKIIGDKSAGRRDDAPKIIEKVPLPGIPHGDGRCNQEEKADEDGVCGNKLFAKGISVFICRHGGSVHKTSLVIRCFAPNRDILSHFEREVNKKAALLLIFVGRYDKI